MDAQERAKLRQLRRERQEAGLCIWCGRKRNLSSAHCDVCLVRKRQLMRRKKNANPWRRGSRGGVPLEFRKTVTQVVKVGDRRVVLRKPLTGAEPPSP